MITGSQEHFANTLLSSYTALMKNNNGIISNKDGYVEVSSSLEVQYVPSEE